MRKKLPSSLPLWFGASPVIVKLTISLTATSLLSLMALFTACNPSTENTQRKTLDELYFELTYQETAQDTGDIEKFILRLGTRDDSRDVVQHLTQTLSLREQEVLYYLSYRLQNEIYLEQAGKKILPALYHYERSYDVKPHRTIDLAFPLLTRGEFTVVIDSELFDVGPVKMNFQKAKTNT